MDVALGWYWSWEPDLSEVHRRDGAVAGETMTREVIHVASTLLDKPGGYLSNDMLPHRRTWAPTAPPAAD